MKNFYFGSILLIFGTQMASATLPLQLLEYDCGNSDVSFTFDPNDKSLSVGNTECSSNMFKSGEDADNIFFTAYKGDAGGDPELCGKTATVSKGVLDAVKSVKLKVQGGEIPNHTCQFSTKSPVVTTSKRFDHKNKDLNSKYKLCSDHAYSYALANYEPTMNESKIRAVFVKRASSQKAPYKAFVEKNKNYLNYEVKIYNGDNESSDYLGFGVAINGDDGAGCAKVDVSAVDNPAGAR